MIVRCSLRSKSLYKLTSRRWLSTSSPQAAFGEAPMELVANIVLAVTDRQPSKILHVYPECSMNKFLSEHAIFEVVGFSELPDGNIGRLEKYERDHYSSVLFSEEPFHPSLRTQLRTNSFHVVVCCAPPQPPSPSSSSTTASTSTSTSNSTSNSCSSSRFDSALSVWELLRITASSGHLVLGAPSSEFRRRGYLEELQRTSEGSNTSPFRGSLLSIQHVQLAATETGTQLQRQRQEQHQSVAGSTGNATGDDAGENDNEYTIALYRKL